MDRKSLVQLAARALALLTACMGLMLAGCNLGKGGSATAEGAATSNCATPPAEGAGPTTLVLVDRTTVLEPQDRLRLVKEFAAYWQREGGRVTVTLTGGVSPSLTRTTYQGWLPLSSDSAGAADKSWSTTPAEARAAAACNLRQLHGLEQALTAALDDVDAGDHALSPLVEALSAVLGRAADRHGAYRLVYIADGMQHTQSLSLYQPRSDVLRNMAPTALVDDLSRTGALPDATGVAVLHLAIGLSADHGGGAAARNLRPPEETRRLEAMWSAVYAAGHARAVGFAHPLPVGGLRFAAERS